MGPAISAESAESAAAAAPPAANAESVEAAAIPAAADSARSEDEAVVAETDAAAKDAGKDPKAASSEDEETVPPSPSRTFDDSSSNGGSHNDLSDSNGKGDDRDGEEAWDDNDAANLRKKDRAAAEQKRRFHKRLLGALAVAAVCLGGIAAGAAAVRNNHAGIHHNATAAAGASQSSTPTQPAGGLCAAANEKAVGCGAKAQAGRPAGCCEGLVCRGDEKGVYPKNVCVEDPDQPSLSEEEGDMASLGGGESVSGESPEEEDDDEEKEELPSVVIEEGFCGTDRVRAWECGNEKFSRRPKKCCDGYVCNPNGGGPTFCVIDKKGPLAPSLTVSDDPKAYQPGHLRTTKNGVLLSAGLDCRVVATKGEKVKQFDPNDKESLLYKSDIPFHKNPDFGATFPTADGGWVYVSNSEVMRGDGGVGALTFDRDGNVVDYKMLLTGTSMNCGGGELVSGYNLGFVEYALSSV